jgi:hypothetical protein
MNDRLSNVARSRLQTEYFAVSGDRATFLVVDGAAATGLIDRLYDDDVEFSCLLTGDLSPDMHEVAPYLVRLIDRSPFYDWFVDVGFGRHFGIVFSASEDMKWHARKLRKLLRARSPEGEPVFFRFYDPRVMRTYLPSCREAEVVTWFDGVEYYFVEGEDGSVLLRFSAGGSVVHTETIPLGAG